MGGTNLSLHHRAVESVFELIGDDENGISYALGWVLAQSPKFLKTFIRGVNKQRLKFRENSINLQEYGCDGGFTDFEIMIDGEFYAIIEAKKGLRVPEVTQLRRYRPRFGQHPNCKKLFITLSNTSTPVAKEQLPEKIYSVPVRHVSWAEMVRFLNLALRVARGRERSTLLSFKNYVNKVIAMPNNQTNLVWCVALSTSHTAYNPLTPLQIVEEKRKYFYPIEKNWPDIPPKYIAFRYMGKLHSIHHVDRYETTTNFHKQIKELPSKKRKPHYVLHLGPGFEPRKEVRSGNNIWSNGRLWIEIDSLFTCNTIGEAVNLTKKRAKKYE